MSELAPCSALQAHDLIARVASSMNNEGVMTDPPFRLRAGYCRLCGHKLPHAYSITACQKLPSAELPEGQFRQILLTEGEQNENVGAEGVGLSDSIALVYAKGDNHTGWPTVVVAAIACCDCLTSDLFNRASRIKRAQTAEREKKVRDTQYTRDRASTLAREAAARHMAKDL